MAKHNALLVTASGLMTCLCCSRSAVSSNFNPCCCVIALVHTRYTAKSGLKSCIGAPASAQFAVSYQGPWQHAGTLPTEAAFPNAHCFIVIKQRLPCKFHDTKFPCQTKVWGLLQCLSKAIAACKPGMRYRDVGDIITSHASSQGYVQILLLYLSCHLLGTSGRHINLNSSYISQSVVMIW